MFFSPELLSRRDSGFGLLWLAATLGSKSTFKRLPKKSVLTADISQLCDLIARPEEPLALRLSSNLMVGVARVYKVKQELFMTDVSNCVSSLKKVVQEFQSKAVTDVMLQMAQPVVRPAALNIAADPNAAYMMDFDALVADWDEFLNVGDNAQHRPEVDDYDPEDRPARNNKPNSKVKNPNNTLTEDVRADMCTLKEHHDHLLSNSFDLSFQGSTGGVDVSSSQPGDAGFQPAADNFFLDGLDIDFGLSDELARELGEGWGISPVRNNKQHSDINMEPLPPSEIGDGRVDLGMDFMLGPGEDAPMDIVQDDAFFIDPAQLEAELPEEVPQTPSRKKVKTSSALRKENQTPRSREKSLPPTGAVLSPASLFSRQFLSQVEPTPPPASPLHDTTSNNNNRLPNKEPNSKKQKRTRLLLDARTELTDEELQLARAQYLEGQNELRRDMHNKKLEKDSGRIIEEMIWGVPTGIDAPELVDFWQENFKVQVEARTGIVRLHKGKEH
ncbi:R8 protein [Stygiomarasmius scandens]|uniref:R8 protein n=1 Tax=Marasmiellus scandens TaxID=2682957 RepID=A0ABR1JX13_9AGAR